MPENVFEDGVAHFWGIHETRPYMRAKFELICTMSVMPAHGAISTGLAEAMDCLRLCRSDNMGVHDAVPTLQLLLGKLQASYDFIKWWATCDPHGTYDWGNTELPYLSVDMTESLEDFERNRAVFHLAALTFIKMTLAKELEDAVNARVVAESASLPGPVGDSLSGFLSNVGDRSLDELKTLQEKLAKQAREAFQLVHSQNQHYWKAVLDPMPLAREPDPGYYSPRDRFEIKLWVVPSALLWREAHAFIKENLRDDISTTVVFTGYRFLGVDIRTTPLSTTVPWRPHVAINTDSHTSSTTRTSSLLPGANPSGVCPSIGFVSGSNTASHT